jgi:hypothetical protein
MAIIKKNAFPGAAGVSFSLITGLIFATTNKRI